MANYVKYILLGSTEHSRTHFLPKRIRTGVNQGTMDRLKSSACVTSSEFSFGHLTACLPASSNFSLFVYESSLPFMVSFTVRLAINYGTDQV
jgi:hypothetical protein